MGTEGTGAGGWGGASPRGLPGGGCTGLAGDGAPGRGSRGRRGRHMVRGKRGPSSVGLGGGSGGCSLVPVTGSPLAVHREETGFQVTAQTEGHGWGVELVRDRHPRSGSGTGLHQECEAQPQPEALGVSCTWEPGPGAGAEGKATSAQAMGVTGSQAHVLPFP